MYGLMDCNNFFVSCERAFRPDLETSPVVVLSNNDGCIVSRSNEAKAMGIPMGLPFFRLKEYDRRNEVVAFSSNFVLYADMSKRVMSILKDDFGDVFPYSIDESFFAISDKDSAQIATAQALPSKILKYTGIPVSIGLAPTKTLAKLASKFAKKHKGYKGCCIIDTDEKRRKALSLFPLADVWGIGRRTISMLERAGFHTADDFTQMSEHQVRRLMGVTGVRTWYELRGQDSIELDNIETKKSICTSRSFAELISDEDRLRSTVASFASMCAFKLRKQGSVASIVSVYITTNRFDERSPQYSNVGTTTLLVAASNQIEIVMAAERALKTIFMPGLKYKKAGVVVSGISSNKAIQQAFFDENADKRDKLDKLTAVVDGINRNNGMDTIHLASQQPRLGSNARTQQSQAKQNDAGRNIFLSNLRREHISPRYTTCLDEVLKVNTSTKRDRTL